MGGLRFRSKKTRFEEEKMKEESNVRIPKQGPVIAIDGPAGTGKSTATRRLAEALGFVHVDTGSLYRAVALLSLEKKPATLENETENAAVFAREVHLEFRRISGMNPANRIFANGRDLTDFI